MEKMHDQTGINGKQTDEFFRDYHLIGPDGPQRIPGRILKLTCFAKAQTRKPSFTREQVVISRGQLQCIYNLFYKQEPCITIREKKNTILKIIT